MIFGEPTLRHDAVTSTQDIARNLAANGAPAGTVVTARFQTQGRGRRGRTWYAPPGANVCLTAIAPPIPAPNAWQIALVAGLAVAEAVMSAFHIRVRFPNDVLLGGAKLAGVLVETLPAPEPTGRVVPLIGIGVNVNVAVFEPEVCAGATSLLRATGVPHDVAVVERAVLGRLGLCWDEWEHGGLAATLARWKPLADPDARRTFVLDGRPAVCRLRDLKPDGTLVIETAEGVVHTLPAASILLEDAVA